MNEAGKLFRISELIYDPYIKSSFLGGDGWVFKVGDNFQGGIIAFFDESGNHVGIVAKHDLPAKLTHKRALAECSKITMEGNSDWYIPDYESLKTIHEKLHKNDLGNFKDEDYLGLYCAINLKKGEKTKLLDEKEYNIRLMRTVRIIRK